VVGPLPAQVASPEPSLLTGNTLQELNGDWTVDLNGKQLTTPLKSWEELGTASFAGPATYRKQFTVAAPSGKQVFLEIADLHDYASLKVNGTDAGAHAWQPYRWDLTSALKPGPNEIEIQVRANVAGGRGGAGGGGRGRGQAVPPTSGLLGPVRLVAR